MTKAECGTNAAKTGGFYARYRISVEPARSLISEREPSQ